MRAAARIARALLCLSSVTAAAWAAPPPAVAAQNAPAVRPVAAASRVRVLASTEGPFSAFGDPSASQTGWVVFHATRKDGREGIFSTSGGVPASLAIVGGQVPDGERVRTIARLGKRPTVSERLTCAFTVEFREGGRAVTVSHGVGREIEFVADSSEAFRTFGDDAIIDAQDAVLFRAVIDPPGHPDTAGFDPSKVTDPRARADPDQFFPPRERATFDGHGKALDEGLFLEAPRDRSIVGDTAHGFLAFQDDFALNDGGAVAFVAAKRTSHWSLFVTRNGQPVEAAQTGAEWSAFHRPAINAAGRVAFVAETKDGAAVVARLPAAGGPPMILIDADAGFEAIGDVVSIDDRGTVAFIGRREDGSGGLYLVERPGDARLVLPFGAEAGKSKVRALRLSNRAFGRPGQITALAALEPDGQAILSVDSLR